MSNQKFCGFCLSIVNTDVFSSHASNCKGMNEEARLAYTGHAERVSSRKVK